MDDQNRILAGLILNCKPEDLKGTALKADGSLAVVAPNGMKFVFSPVELDNARDSFCLPATPMAEPVEASRYAQIVTSTSSVTGSGSMTGNPMAEPVEAIERGLPDPPIPPNPRTSIPARQKPPCGTGASSANGHTPTTRHRKEARQ